MPLRARQGEKDILAFEYDEASWSALKDSYEGSELLMPCCDSKAIPKTSKLGNFFFAHAVKGDCISEAESQEHIWVKGLIARSAKECGWDVKTEWLGETPSGEKWIADVFCIKGNAQIAIEVQLSRQSVEDTLERQFRYKNSGVRCVWFASSSVFNDSFLFQSKETPFFIMSPPTVGQEPTVPKFYCSLLSFVKGMLNGKLKWVEEHWEYSTHYTIHYIHYIEDVCWKCKKSNKQVYGHSIDVYGDHAKTVPNASTILEGMMGIISNAELKRLGLNLIGKFEKLKGNAPNFPYCNVCMHCGAPQNNYYLMQKLVASYNDENIKTGSVKYSVKYTDKKKVSGQWIYTGSP